MEKFLKALKAILATLTLLVLGLFMAAQLPVVQRSVLGIVTDSLGEKLDGKISFSHIHLRFFNAVAINDLLIMDDHPPVTEEGESIDTLAHLKTVVATFSIKDLLNENALRVTRVSASDGCFNFVSEAKGASNVKRIFGGGKQKPKEKAEADTTGNGLRLDFKNVKIKSLRFRLINLAKERKEYGIDWGNLDLTVRQLDAGDISVADGLIKGSVNKLEADERSGYKIKSLTANCELGNEACVISDIHLVDDWSDLYLAEYSMHGPMASYKDFINEIRMKGQIEASSLSSKSLSYFVPALKDMDLLLDLRGGSVDGTVNSLKISDLNFTEESSSVHCALSGKVADILSGNPAMDIALNSLEFTTSGLSKLLGGVMPGKAPDLSKYARGTALSLSGKAKGRLNDLLADISLNSSDAGSLSASVTAKGLTDSKRSTDIGGSLQTNSLEVGNILGVKQLGALSMRAAADASLGGPEGLTVKLDTLAIGELGALGYDYSNINAVGTYSDKAFDGRIVCSDPNLNFIFQGLFTLSNKTSNSAYKFLANIGYADLNALNLDKRGTSKVEGRIVANYMNLNERGLVGDLDVQNLKLESGLGTHDIGDICIKSLSRPEGYRMLLESGFANGKYSGTKPILSIIKDLQGLTINRELPALAKDSTYSWNSAEYSASLEIGDAWPLLSFISPGLYVAKGTSIELDIDKDGLLEASLNSPRLAMNKNSVKNLDLTLDNSGDGLNATAKMAEITAANFTMLNGGLSLHADDNRFSAGISYDNETSPANKADLLLTGTLGRDENGGLTVNGQTLPTYFWIDGDMWKISRSAIEYAGGNVSVDELSLSSKEQSIMLDGGFSTSEEADTLDLRLNNFDLAILNGKGSLGLSGHATGNAMLTSPWNDNAGALLKLSADSLALSGGEIGNLKLGGSYEGGLITVKAYNELDGHRSLNVSGLYDTGSKDLNASADFDRMDVGFASGFLTGIFSEMAGELSGKISVDGQAGGELAISSEETRLDNGMLKVDFTKVPYYVSGPLIINNEGVFFDDMALTDRYDGTGTLSGGITFGGFKDMRMDTRIRMNSMEALDMKSSDGQAIYGNVFASGDVSITGPFSSILLDVNARTAKNGDIHIPIDNASMDSSSDLLTFTEPPAPEVIDPYEMLMNSLNVKETSSGDFGMILRVRANNSTKAHVEIDRSTGSGLVGEGQGNIVIEVRPASKHFSIDGDYTLSSGNFHYNVMNIVTRDFGLTEGSSIRFNGDIMDSDLDINGVYSTKASVATLIADSTATNTRRTVNCGIGISGKMREPQLTFSIDVPDLDPTTKSKVESALSTEDKVQKQFISLLVSNGFIPDEQSGITNNSNTLLSNVADIMANQLNNILQKLEIPLDLGLNYQYSDSGADIFDVAVSTQLFNNRVIVNGNVGNRDYGTSSSTDVVGDVDIDIKLDKPGQLRLNLFSHSADDYTNYLDNTQRNGVGITYQREFSRLKAFFRNLFMSKKKREEIISSYQERAARGETPVREQKTIVIE